ncbi:hypothetical protein [Pseudomonas sp. B21-048]|uniref:hypothetical protein n=1 Tax=Pseudomonas sp. B21-048 TaxID=2895490 RepID=UPI00215E1139|nr:hypothetical protein [Pseudomonas sp. B21-048]UVL00924.1 hypothetical protein LOY56_11505 [Pseudomonas sp. B21-048]
MTQSQVKIDALPAFFRDIEIIGPAVHEIPKYKALHASLLFASSAKQNIEVTADSSPVLLASRSVKEIYQSNNFSQIKDMERKAQNDLQAIYTNVSQNGTNAWTKVRSQGKDFYMSWSDTGSMWSFTDSITQTAKKNQDGETTYQAKVQIGTYTQTGKIAGIHTYNLTLPTLLVESVVALIVAKAVSGIIADGLGFLVANFAMYLTSAAAELGLESFSFFISEALLATVASCLVFAVVFIGLAYLWDWLNRQYTIRLQIFNWDGDHDWNADGQYMSNAKISGDNSTFDFNLPKLTKPGNIVTPPGFQPVEALESVCYYAVIIWQNDSTFMQGCSAALRMQRDGSSDGFMWAFDCPRWSDNQQASTNGTSDPKTYLNNPNWNNNPKNFSIESTSSKTPINLALDALSGASDNLYNFIININKKS